MRFAGIGVAALLAVPFVDVQHAAAQSAPQAADTTQQAITPATTPAIVQPASESMLLQANSASTWSAGGANVIQLEDAVSIELDRVKLTAERAVLWLEPVPGAALDVQRAEIALIGDARIQGPQVVRSGERIMTHVIIRGGIRITADQREARDASDSETFQQAMAMREAERARAVTQPTEDVRLGTPVDAHARTPTTRGAAPATQAIRRNPPVMIGGEPTLDITSTPEGKLAAVLSGGFVLIQQQENGDLLELRAQRGVLFTPLARLKDAEALQQARNIHEFVTAAYLEGDVRVTYTESGVQGAEQRAEAARVFYDFTTDRAVFTDAVLHAIDPERNIPIILRAGTLRQLAKTDRVTEFNARDIQLTTSSFKTPSFGIAADKVYVRQTETNDPRYGNRTTFMSRDTTFNFFGIPLFYTPALGGSMTDAGTPLRAWNITNSRGFGTGIQTQWGLFETLGRMPPDELDITYRLDYYDERGAAVGLDAEYGGGFITDTTRQPWNFQGELTSYFPVNDFGVDNLGRFRGRPEGGNELRGRAKWEHQHFFPENWQMQLRAAYVSDATFLEEWFEREYDNGLPHETSAYFKHQVGSEALTLLATLQPNDVVTSSEFVAEQFEIERLPEIGYHRIGDSLGDRLTLFSNNTVSGLRFNENEATLGEQGFGVRRGRLVFPGRPSLGRLGVPGAPVAVPGLTEPDGTPAVPEDWNYRGDFRQEIDAPFSLGQFKVVPYVLGRYTGYTETPDGGRDDRLYAGTGIRLNTSFWKIDDTAQSRLLDINRVRHIIEPELHLYTAAQTTDRSDLFIYDEHVDAIDDFSAAQIALRQRWQTKRGGPGRLRSVDFFTLNVEANLFADQPPENELEPVGFRGVFYPSLPEASIPRNSLNVDGLWRISDTTIVLGDVQHNLDEQQLATAGLGLAAQRDDRMTYFIGMRYIEDLDSAVASFVLEYELTRKYSVAFNQSYDFGDEEGNVHSSAALRRKFDRFFMMLTVYHDANENESGFRFALYPEGLGVGLGSDTLGGLVGQ